MKLCDLSLRDFRNYEELELSFEPGVNLIVGANAQGKTNLLEAIGFLGSGKSFRAQKQKEMIRFGADFCDISGNVYAQERQQNLRWVLFESGRPRQLWRNGAKKKTAGEIAFAVDGIAVDAGNAHAADLKKHDRVLPFAKNKSVLAFLQSSCFEKT